MNPETQNIIWDKFSEIHWLLIDNQTATTKIATAGIILIIIAAAIIIIRQQKIIKMLRELKEQDKP